MANLGDISKMQLPNGDIVNIKDANSADMFSPATQEMHAALVSATYDSSTSKTQIAVVSRVTNGTIGDTKVKRYILKESGLIATNNVDKKGIMYTDLEDVSGETFVRHNTSDISGYDVFTYTWTKSSSSVGDVWYIRPYVTFTYEATGTDRTLYGPVYDVTVGQPCTIKQDVMTERELTEAEKRNETDISTNKQLGYLQNYNLSPIVGGNRTNAGVIDTKDCFLPAGTYYVSWKTTRNTGFGAAKMIFYDGNGTSVGQALINNSTTRTEVSVTLTDDCEVIELTNTNNVTINIYQVMITETANQSFVPYAPSNAELYNMLLSLMA